MLKLHTSVAHRGVSSPGCDPLLALEIHRVHHALIDLLIGAEHSDCHNIPVYERRLAVVDVSDDREVAGSWRARAYGQDPKERHGKRRGTQVYRVQRATIASNLHQMVQRWRPLPHRTT